MEPTDSIKLVINKIVGQHGEFAKSMRRFDIDLCHMDTSSNSTHTIEEIRKFLKQDLVEHFRCEEELLFPAALMLSDDPYLVHQIVRLLQDHWEIMHRLGYLEEKYPHFLVGTEHSEAEVKYARALLLEIQNHNHRELREFYPKFESDPAFLIAVEQCRADLQRPDKVVIKDLDDGDD